jgi:hypothetical protein
MEEFQEALTPIQERLATLEAENAALRDKLSLAAKGSGLD